MHALSTALCVGCSPKIQNKTRTAPKFLPKQTQTAAAPLRSHECPPPAHAHARRHRGGEPRDGLDGDDALLAAAAGRDLPIAAPTAVARTAAARSSVSSLPRASRHVTRLPRSAASPNCGAASSYALPPLAMPFSPFCGPESGLCCYAFVISSPTLNSRTRSHVAECTQQDFTCLDAHLACFDALAQA